MFSWEAEERARCQSSFNAGAALRARQYVEAAALAKQNEQQRARLGVLREAFIWMLRSHPDVFDGGFNVDVAAEQCLPVIAPLIRPRS